VHESASTNYRDIVFDSTNNKVIISYQNQGSSPAYQLYGVVGTVSSTSISFGTSVSAGANTRAYDQGMAYDTKAQKAVVGFWDHYDSKGRYIPLTVSGTNITWGTGALLNGFNLEYVAATFDSNSNRVVFGFKDHGNSNYGTAVVLQNGFTNENLTTENFIGTSAHSAADGAKVLVNTQGAIDENQSGLTAGQTFFVDKNGALQLTTNITESLGSETVFESDTMGEGGYGSAAAFDSSNNRVIIVYQDSTNSSYGTACVGLVSGTTITFGTPTVFESTTSGTFGVDFDSSNNKVIIGYRDGSEDGHAIVGTISGTSISFGTAVVFDSGNSGNGINFLDLAFDSNENRAVIVYRDSVNQSGASTHGRAIVGTVSGTDISFGSVVTFNSGETSGCKVAFDSSNNRIVICYTDSANSNYGTAIVGTVSGTSISFGSEVVFESATSLQTVIAFDSTNNKVVIAYRDNGNSGKGTAIVGTVSGTSISFGSAVEYEQGDVDDQAITFDSNVGKVVIAYFDGGNSNYGTYIVGTVSGTSISFGTAAVFNAGTTQYTSATFDSNENKAVIFFRDDSDSNKGKGIVLQNANDLSGSLSTDAVTAGTALSATKLLVKG